MPVIATLRVVPAYPSVNAPPPERVRDAANRLRGLGLEVVNTGRYSVIIAAEEGLFEEVLGVRAPQEDAGLAQNFQPRERSLRGIVDRVEIAPPAQFLDV
jgi:hypothetical protein